MSDTQTHDYAGGQWRKAADGATFDNETPVSSQGPADPWQVGWALSATIKAAINNGA